MAIASPSPVMRGLPEWGECLRRILESQTFSRCSRLKAFLQYVVGCAEEGRLHEVNEYSLGVSVFGRPTTFSPSEDNIVRVTARQLRVKLEEYYHGEGAQDPWRIEIPKGAYVPRLVPKPEPAAMAEVAVSDGVDLKPGADEVELRRLWALVAALLVGCAGVVIGMWAGGAMASPETPSAHAIEALFADPAIPITLIMEDPLLPEVRKLTGRTPNLNEMLNGTYLDSAAYPEAARGGLLPLIVAGDLVRPAAVQLYGELHAVASSRGAQVQAVQARRFNPKQIGQGSVVILGGIGSNPWVGAMQDHMAFEHRIDEQAKARVFVNRHPLAGEPAAFVTNEKVVGGQRFYTRIAVMPNPHGRGTVVMLGGTSQQSTAGAFRFAMSRDGALEVASRCGKPVASLPYFEAILETESVANTPTRWSVKAIRCEAPAH